MSQNFPVSLQLSIPFQNNKQAQVALKSLSPDPILKVDQSKITYDIINDNKLSINVQGLDDRIIRVTVNNLLENLKTVIECFETFEAVQS